MAKDYIIQLETTSILYKLTLSDSADTTFSTYQCDHRLSLKLEAKKRVSGATSIPAGVNIYLTTSDNIRHMSMTSNNIKDNGSFKHTKIFEVKNAIVFKEDNNEWMYLTEWSEKADGWASFQQVYNDNTTESTVTMQFEGLGGDSSTASETINLNTSTWIAPKVNFHYDNGTTATKECTRLTYGNKLVFSWNDVRPSTTGFIGWGTSRDDTPPKYPFVGKQDLEIAYEDTDLYAITSDKNFIVTVKDYDGNGSTKDFTTKYNSSTGFTANISIPLRYGYKVSHLTSGSKTYSGSNIIITHVVSDMEVSVVWAAQGVVCIHYHSNKANYGRDNKVLDSTSSVYIHTQQEGYDHVVTHGLKNYTYVANTVETYLNRIGYKGTGYWKTLPDGAAGTPRKAHQGGSKDDLDTDGKTGRQIAELFGVKITNSNEPTFIDVHAEWSPISYKVAYNGNGNTSGSMSTTTHTYDVPATLSQNKYKKTGYTFDGWCTSISGGGAVYADKDSVMNLTSTANEIVTLYAQWRKNKLNISYNANGGTVSNSIVLGDEYYNTLAADGRIIHSKSSSTTDVYNQKWEYNEPETHGLVNISSFGLTRDGYRFVGWGYGEKVFDQDNNDLLPSEITSDILEGDVSITLYAQWVQNELKVYYNANGGKAVDTKVSDTDYYNRVDNDGMLIHSTDPNTTTPYYQSWRYGQQLTEGIVDPSSFGLSRPGYAYLSWNTMPDGSGIEYSPDLLAEELNPDVISKDCTITFYAVWKLNQSPLYINSNKSFNKGYCFVRHDGKWKKGLVSVRKGNKWHIIQ